MNATGLRQCFEGGAPLFSLKNVKYKDILTYPNINLPKDAASFVCGESGSGQSTLLRLLNGVDSPSFGEITYLEKNIEDYDPILLRQEALLVGQSVYLFDMPIKECFDEYYSYRGLEKPCESYINKFLNICSINLPLDCNCQVLSGGERQRVFIAINLSLAPKVLMMDEPTSALDDKNANALMENIRAYCGENDITLIVVSHDKSIAKKYADNIVTLSGGRGK